MLGKIILSFSFGVCLHLSMKQGYHEIIVMELQSCKVHETIRKSALLETGISSSLLSLSHNNVQNNLIYLYLNF